MLLCYYTIFFQFIFQLDCSFYSALFDAFPLLKSYLQYPIAQEVVITITQYQQAHITTRDITNMD